MHVLDRDADSRESVIINEIVKGAIIPGAMISGVFGVSYALMFSQVLYKILALLMGVGFNARRLDPAVLLDYWEDEDKRRNKEDRKAEGMFA